MKNYGDSSTEPSLFGMTGHLDYVANKDGRKIEYAEINENSGSSGISYEEETRRACKIIDDHGHEHYDYKLCRQ